MFVQGRVYDTPEWIEDKIDALTPCELCCRNKIRVSCNQYDLIDLSLKAQGCYIQADAHIHTLLDSSKFEIIIYKIHEIEAAVQELLQPSSSQSPLGLVEQVSKTQRHLALLPQFIVQ